MPIELPRGLLFAVDTWTPASALKRHRFLTHAHRDHLAGITTTNIAAVYASRLTVLIVRHIFPQLDRDAFVEMELGTPVLVPDPDGDFTVTAFDANHCPGAVMFLFEGAFGNVLHTGDCRLTPDCLQGLPLGYINADGSAASQASRRIDYLFLDCTFARCSLQFPSKEDSVRQVINCIWKQPNAPVVYLVSDMLGQEEILIEVSRVLGSKIYVDREKNSECYHTLSHVAPEILTEDASSRLQVMGFPRLSERAAEMLAMARAKQQPEPLIIRPSSQWYANYVPPDGSLKQKPTLAEPMRDEFGVWHVCFSMHSSREELDQALRLVKPKWVISTTPPCRAMELAYVKKHCFQSRLGPDDPLWKLLRLSDGKPAVAGSIDKSTCSVEDSSFADRSEVQDVVPMLEDFEITVEQPVTLFGRARFGLPQDCELWKEEYVSVGVIEQVKFEAEEQQHSATESELWKDAESDMSSDVIGLIEVGPKERDSAIESESWKGCKPVDDVEVTDITEEEVKEHGSSTDSELGKDEKCDESVKGIGDGKFQAKGQNLAVEAEFWEVRKPWESVELTEGGENKIHVTEQILAADYSVSSSSGESNKEDATEDCTVPSETGKKPEGPDRASGHSSSNAIGSSKGLNANLRRLYRSMNVPVPRPLPSLVELMGASKRARVSPVVQL